MHALRVGDLDALRRGLGKDDQLQARASALRESLDPPAWLVALGAVTREHDLHAAAAAMDAGNAAGLRDALGFSPQALHDDVLAATHSVKTRRARDLKYYIDGRPALAAFDGWSIPALPPGVAALHVTALADVDERMVRIHFGLDAGGHTDLRAATDLAGRAQPTFNARASAARARDLLKPLMALDCDWLDDPRFRDATIRLLHDDGRLAIARLSRGEDWHLLEHDTSMPAERLAALRDGRLLRIQRTASAHAQSHGRWPRDANLLLLRSLDWADPAAPGARQGWADLAPEPPRGFELLTALEPDDVAVVALAVTPDGRRAVTRRGTLLWVP